MVAFLSNQIPRDVIHRLLMILRREQVAIAVHSHLKTAMPRKCLHCLGRQTSFNPSRYRKMPQAVPRQTNAIGLSDGRFEMTLNHVVMANITSALVAENQVS